MDELKQAAAERIESLRRKVIEFKRIEGMNNSQLADFFELERSTVRNFINGSEPSGLYLTVYVTALGVEL